MNIRSRSVLLVAATTMAAVVSGCDLLFTTSTDSPESTIAPITITEEADMVRVSGGNQYPDVLVVELRPQSDGSYVAAVTLSSPYDTPQRYADGWRVLDAEGNELGSHTLMHDHASEQPFTRTQSGLLIPEGVTEVTVEGRDQANGYGGLTLTVAVPGRESEA